jgi:4-hydroxybenzoate polyprenyltransferase
MGSQIMGQTTSAAATAFGRVRPLIRLTRPHQWSKNLLLFLPALAGHLEWTPDNVSALLRGFLAFSFLSSLAYVVNDVRDVADDRLHPTKCLRPLAAGQIGTAEAVGLAVLLAASSLLLAGSLPAHFQLALGCYAIGSGLYTLALKARLLVDVIVLAALYTLRVVAGAALVGVPLSRWFLPFSIFFFLSLALVKRVTELRRMAPDSGPRRRGRAYRAVDAQVLTAMGIACIACAALVYCQYISSHDVTHLYRTPDFLWGGLPLLLYWQARIWVFALRDDLHDDPVVFALRDRVSFLTAGAFLLVVWLAA